MHTTYTSRSHSWGGSHLSHEKNTKAMQQEIDHLRRELRHKRRRRPPSISDFSSNDEEDGSYRRTSRTPLSDSLSYDEEYHHEHRNRNSCSKGLGNDALCKAFKRISRSIFTCRIEKGRLSRRFTQPTFTMYNGCMDLVEHVSHFN